MFSNFDLKRLKQLDGYSKPIEELRIRTLSGGCVTLITSLIIILLFINEVRYYSMMRLNQELVVDKSHEDRIRIHIDIVFPRVGCAYLTLDTMSSSGELQLSADHDLSHTRLDEYGRPIGKTEKHVVSQSPEVKQKRSKEGYCGSCYGAESETTKCCNSCDEVRSAYQSRGWVLKDLSVIEQCRDEGVPGMMEAAAKEGCRFNGTIRVEKVVGNMHFAPGKSYQAGGGNVHVHDISSMTSTNYNFTHFIRHLAFGDNYPSLVNPLDGNVIVADELSQRYTYHVKVVPTVYTKIDSTVLVSNQYSVTKNKKSMSMGGGVPGVFINYEFSPISVRLTEYRNSLLHLITNVCAIVGGVFTVFSLIDAGIYHVLQLKERS